MSAELQTALVNEVLDLSNMFKQNCALKHGLPEVKNNRISKLDPPPKPEPIKVDIPNNIPAAPAASNSPSPGATVAADTDKRSLVKTAVPWLLGAAIGTAGPLAYAWYTGGGDAVKVEAAKQKQSLLDALQNQGFHLDPERGAEWQTP
jgi:hypothetical protein